MPFSHCFPKRNVFHLQNYLTDVSSENIFVILEVKKHVYLKGQISTIEM